MEKKPKVVLVQDGARGHYGLALALHQAGILEVMFTDFFVQKGSVLDKLSPVLGALGNKSIKRMLDRQCAELDGVRVRTSLFKRMRQMRRRKEFPNNTAFWCWQSADTGKWIAPQLLPPINILMGFIRNLDPNLCRHASQIGIQTVGDQMIAPAAIEKREYQLQQERFPGWEQHNSDELDAFAASEEASWPMLDAITCPSDYVADGLVSLGNPREKVNVIHYPIDEEAFSFVDRAGRSGPVRVGFVGQVGLRKGVPYFLEVANRFSPKDVEFILVGHSALTAKAMQKVKTRVNALHALRSEIPALLASFDLIYFPTTCEGSAYALMEAMATGLPIVTSPNSGTVTRHGIEGFICPYDNLDEATRHIEMLVANPDLRHKMGRASSQRYRQFGLKNYSNKLLDLCQKLVNSSTSNQELSQTITSDSKTRIIG